jgi:hypothetical protein
MNELKIKKSKSKNKTTLVKHISGVCLIGSETVTTFDGLFYNASFSGCDQVLTKDCSGRYKFAVLSRVEGDKKVNYIAHAILPCYIINSFIGI